MVITGKDAKRANLEQKLIAKYRSFVLEDPVENLYTVAEKFLQSGVKTDKQHIIDYFIDSFSAFRKFLKREDSLTMASEDTLHYIFDQRKVFGALDRELAYSVESVYES